MSAELIDRALTQAIEYIDIALNRAMAARSVFRGDVPNGCMQDQQDFIQRATTAMSMADALLFQASLALDPLNND